MGLFVAAVALYAGWIKVRSLGPGLPLRVAWEGLWIDFNFRDVGASVNDCLGSPKLRPNLLYRANVWFSGWSCDRVGRPTAILSLNFDPPRNERYFCHDDETGENRIGRYFNTDFRLADLEFVSTWDDPRVRTAACGFLAEGLQVLARRERLLIHCDAGKDRTGAMAALLAALAAESVGALDAPFVAALECDYRKSQRLEREKYDRVRSFIQTLQAQGGVGAFAATHCGVDPTLTAAVATHWLLPNKP